jgi:hypothetical protein
MEDNIKTGLQGMGCGGMDWIDATLDRDKWRVPVNAVINLLVPCFVFWWWGLSALQP